VRVPAPRPRLAWAPINQRIPGAKKDWAFIQNQWLLSPDTTGWLGGPHSPVRIVQQYVMLSAKLTSRRSLAAGLHYVTLVRDPIKVRAAFPLASTVRCLPPLLPLPALPL
jgi:hypothetical protein